MTDSHSHMQVIADKFAICCDEGEALSLHFASHLWIQPTMCTGFMPR